MAVTVAVALAVIVALTPRSLHGGAAGRISRDALRWRYACFTPLRTHTTLTPSLLETLFFTNLLKVSTGRDFGALNELRLHPFFRGLLASGAPYLSRELSAMKR